MPMPCSSAAAMCAGTSRRASRPPCTRGCSVLTRPSIISGKPVRSSIGRTGTPASASALAVPPVETISTPNSVGERAAELDDAGLVGDRHERALDGGLGHRSLPWQRARHQQCKPTTGRGRECLLTLSGERRERVGQCVLAIGVAGDGVRLAGPRSRPRRRRATKSLVSGPTAGAPEGAASRESGAAGWSRGRETRLGTSVAGYPVRTD